MRRVVRATIVAGMGPLLLGALLVGAAEAKREYSEEGAKGCIDCHETSYVMGIFETVHLESDNPDTPAAQKECESCHGPSATHTRFPMQVGNLRFGSRSKTKPEVQNQMCLECHAAGEHAKSDWSASAHGFEKVVCSTCHSIHDPEAIVPAKAKVTEGCTESCHDDLMNGAEPAQFSHALGRNLGGMGELTCAGCHDPHGPLSSVRCGECHAMTPDEIAKQSEKAKRFHQVAAKKGTDCMRCHKGIAHPIPPLVLLESKQEMERMLGE